VVVAGWTRASFQSWLEIFVSSDVTNEKEEVVE